MDDLISIV
jgi:TusA-related sulfurtransferase